jgi:hypothetical protein
MAPGHVPGRLVVVFIVPWRGVELTRETGKGLGAWRALVLIGAAGVGIGLVGQILILGLLAPPVAILGVIGPTVARSRQS